MVRPDRVTLALQRIVIVIWISIALCFVAAMTRQVPALPGNDLGIRRFRTPPIGEHLTLAQTFTMTGDDFSAVELYATSLDARPSGNIRLLLSDLTGPDVLIREQIVRADSLVRSRAYRFEFAPIARSKDRTYRLELVATDMSSAVVLWATRGDSYGGGALLANGRPRWADLAFRTFASTRSSWSVVWGQMPGGRLALGALAGFWMALGTLLRYLLRVSAVSSRRQSWQPAP